MSRFKWTRDDDIIALNAYLQIGFGKPNGANNSVVQQAADLATQKAHRDESECTPKSMSMRIGNIISLNPPPHDKRRGLGNAAQQTRDVWKEFQQKGEVWLAKEMKRIRKSVQNT
ncbi:MAG: hypothetical protein ACR2PV_00815 [Gammaproteobacteria bacterium]